MLLQAYSVSVGRKNTILIIDDDQDLRDILATKLAGPHTDVITAVNGEDGIAKARQYQPDLVLLDVDMPVMNGVEAFRRLKEDPILGLLNIVFLTNYDEPVIAFPGASAAQEQQMRATGYIRKSSDLDVIAAYVEGILALH